MFSIKKMVNNQLEKVLKRGSRFEKFNQIRQRHFWSTYLFAYGAGNVIAANGNYDLFRVVPGAGTGQGYPVPLTRRETNWENVNRVPDNQNIAITEVGVTLTRPAPVAAPIPTDSVYANLAPALQALIAPQAPIHTLDAYNIAQGMVLQVVYLTNGIPIGKVADFPQSAGMYAFTANDVQTPTLGEPDLVGDPTIGIPAAAFRRKLEIPILLQHGETVSMRLNVPVAIPTLTLAQGGAGWVEVRVDWWAIESFVEKS